MVHNMLALRRCSCGLCKARYEAPALLRRRRRHRHRANEMMSPLKINDMPEQVKHSRADTPSNRAYKSAYPFHCKRTPVQWRDAFADEHWTLNIRHYSLSVLSACAFSQIDVYLLLLLSQPFICPLTRTPLSWSLIRRDKRNESFVSTSINEQRPTLIYSSLVKQKTKKLKLVATNWLALKGLRAICVCCYCSLKSCVMMDIVYYIYVVYVRWRYVFVLAFHLAAKQNACGISRQTLSGWYYAEKNEDSLWLCVFVYVVFLCVFVCLQEGWRSWGGSHMNGWSSFLARVRDTWMQTGICYCVHYDAFADNICIYEFLVSMSTLINFKHGFGKGVNGATFAALWFVLQ